MTGAGATYPYKNDPKDSNIRIAPTLPPLEELESALKVFVCCVKLASVESSSRHKRQPSKHLSSAFLRGRAFCILARKMPSIEAACFCGFVVRARVSLGRKKEG